MRKNLIASAMALALGVTSIAAHADVNTVVGGQMFVDFTNIDSTSKGKNNANDGTGLDVKRFYLTVDHKFDDFWSANLTTDFNYSAPTGETQLFVKTAWLQAKWSNEFALRVGSDGQPWIGYVDGLSGLRYIENSMVDKLGYGNSADWGLHALGSGGDGFWGYNVAVVNGGGFKNPTRSSSVDFEARVNIQPVKGLSLAVGGYNGHFGQDVATLPATQDVRTFNRFDAAVGYNTANLRIGAEYFTAHNNKSNLTYTLATFSPHADRANGYSLWAWYSFAPSWAVFGRYDNASTSKKLDNSRENEYAYGGVEWAVRKGIKLAAVYKHNTDRNDLRTVNNKTDELGIWAEVKF